MKKLLLLLFLIPVFAAAQKTTGGNYTYIAQRYEWLAGVFKALGLPAGSGPAAFTSGQEMRAGAVYFDSLGVDAGFYIWTGSQWVLQGTPLAAELPDELIQPGYVTYSGTGLKFYISPSIIRVDGVIYGTTYDSVTLSASDPDDPRKDVIYVATTGIEVAEGTPAGPAAEPQLEAGQFKLTVIDIPATATTPGITTNIIWDENTESTVTNTGTTTDPDNTTNVYRLTKSVNVTNIGSGDIIHFTLPSTINLNDYNSISGFIDLKAVMSGAASLRIRFLNGATAVSNEVIIGLNRSSTDYQGWSVPLSQFTFSNTFVDRVNIRYIHSGSAVVHAGFFLDYIHTVNGFIQPGGSGTPLTVGPIDTKTASPNGAVIENNVLYNQTASQSNPGLMSPADKTKLDSMHSDYYIRNIGNGTYIAVQENDSTVGVKTFKLIGGTLIDTDSTFGVDLSSFGGFFSPDQTSTGNTAHNAGGFNFTLNNVGDLGLNSETTNLIANSDLTISGDSVRMNSTSGRITFPNLDEVDDTTTYKPTVRDPATGRFRPFSHWPGVGGGGGNLLVEPLGAGVEILQPRNDTLYHRTAIAGSNTVVDTTTLGELRIAVPNADATTNGVITTGTQTIAGGKTFSGATVMSGTLQASGNFFTNSTVLNGNLSVNGGGAVATQTGTAELQIGGSTNAQYRMNSRGLTASTLTANASYADYIQGASVVTEAASGTHGMIGRWAVRAPSITSGAATVGNTFALWLEGPSTATVTGKNYTLWSDAGPNRFDGIFNSGGTDLTANQIWGADAAGTAMEGKTLTNGTNIHITHGAGTATFTGATLTKNINLPTPGSAENEFIFFTPVAITITNTRSVLVGSSSPSVTYNIAFGTDRTSLTNVYTAGQTVTSTTTGTNASGVNDNTIPANSWVVLTTSAQSGTVTAINTSIQFTED